MPINDASEWGPDYRFTPETYAQYEKMRVWERDKPGWLGDSGKRQYRAHYAKCILEWVQQAKKEQSKWKATCQRTVRMCESLEDSSGSTMTIEKGIAAEPLDFAFAQIQEMAALQSNNPPRGEVVATQESQNNYVAALNHLIECERTQNGYDQIQQRNAYEGGFFNLSWIKTGVNFNDYGTFGQKGRITIERVKANDMHVDPRAKEMSWDYMAYLIQEHEMEIGEIRAQYPVTGFEIADTEETSAYTSMLDDRSEDAILSVVSPRLGNTGAIKRQSLKVYECWFKPTILKFVPQRETREFVDPNGVKQYEYEALVLDEDGYVLGDWVPAYPKGRCIVLCEGVILEDIPNRLPHGRSPFIPVPQMPSENLFIPGDAYRILKVAMKMNDRLSDIHAYSQSETQRPMHAEIGVFPNQQYWKRVPNKADKIIPVNPGRAFLRPPPVEIPQFNWVLLEKYEQYMDRISGSSPLMRGNISPEMQVGAGTMAAINNFISSRAAAKAKLQARAEIEVTNHIMWLIRRTYDEKISVQVTLPDGTSSTIDWESDRAVFESGDEQAIARLTSQENYLVNIKAGTGTPNAMQAQQAIADKLMDRKCLTKEAYLDAYQWQNRKIIAKQLDEQEAQDLAAEATGRQVGVNIKRIEKMSGAGRKPKEGQSPGAA